MNSFGRKKDASDSDPTVQDAQEKLLRAIDTLDPKSAALMREEWQRLGDQAAHMPSKVPSEEESWAKLQDEVAVLVREESEKKNSRLRQAIDSHE